MNSSPSKYQYRSSGLTQGSLTLEEIRTLLSNWKPGESIPEYTRRLLKIGILIKKTATRTEGLVVQFNAWFQTPDDRAAMRLQKLVDIGIESQVLNELVFLYKARREAALYDFTIQRFWPAVEAGELYIHNQAIIQFLREAQDKGSLDPVLTESTVIHMARGIGAALLGMGLLKEYKPNLRELVPYRVSDEMINYLVYDLHFTGLTDSAVVEHIDWRLWGLKKQDVVERLSELNKQAGLVIQHAGSVVKITWMHHSMEEVLNAYTR